jgi:hypothetical protein
MSNQTKLIIYSILSFVLFITLMGCNASQTATNESKEELTTYTYIITNVNEEGLKGDSLTDDTGIFLTHDTINQNKLSLKENDKISVSFPADDWETITKVTKIN